MAIQTPLPNPPAASPATVRPPADRFMRALLRIPDGATGDLAGARSAFSTSIFISAARCLLTYIALPLLGPIVGVRGSVGPALGLLLGAVSAVAIVISMRRFWSADHRMRWGYTAIGGAILVFVAVQAVIDVAALLSD